MQQLQSPEGELRARGGRQPREGEGRVARAAADVLGGRDGGGRVERGVEADEQGSLELVGHGDGRLSLGRTSGERSWIWGQGDWVDGGAWVGVVVDREGSG